MRKPVCETHVVLIDGQWAYVELLERLLEDEIERRAQKQLALRVGRAALNTTKTLEGFDWHFNPTINRQQVLQQQVLHLDNCESIRQKRHVLLCGPTGVGKSHLAQALAHEACRQGFACSSSILTRCCSISMAAGRMACGRNG